ALWIAMSWPSPKFTTTGHVPENHVAGKVSADKLRAIGRQGQTEYRLTGHTVQQVAAGDIPNKRLRGRRPVFLCGSGGGRDPAAISAYCDTADRQAMTAVLAEHFTRIRFPAADYREILVAWAEQKRSVAVELHVISREADLFRKLIDAKLASPPAGHVVAMKPTI